MELHIIGLTDHELVALIENTERGWKKVDGDYFRQIVHDGGFLLMNNRLKTALNKLQKIHQQRTVPYVRYD